VAVREHDGRPPPTAGAVVHPKSIRAPQPARNAVSAASALRR
jgi:hypothetical protein